MIGDASGGRVAAVFADVVGIEAPDPGIDLIETGIIDSLTLIELIHALELEFKTELPLEELDIERFRTIDTIAELVGEVSADNSTGAD